MNLAEPDAPVLSALRTVLVVDLDGTLTPTDTLYESMALLSRTRMWDVLRLPAWLAGGRAQFKAELARRVQINVATLPWNEQLLDYLRAQRETGRRIVLATAADRSIAEAVAAHLGLFDAVLSTSGGQNLTGSAKLEAILGSEGPSFVYAGDSRADLKVWAGAAGAVLVGAPKAVESAVQGFGTPIEQRFPRAATRLMPWLKMLRAHQWLKNVLLFVPLLTAFPQHTWIALLTLVKAFIVFSMAASATYIFNDLGDLGNDRAHPRKRERPLASGAISIKHGAVVSWVLIATALVMATQVSSAFAVVMAGYVVLTITYSAALKSYVLLDVLALALLYMLRIVAGAVTIAVPVSSWLLVFSGFVFFSLGMVKRCAELVTLQQEGRTSAAGRDYRTEDLKILFPLGIGASLSAVVVFGLFIAAPETASRYARHDVLWGVACGLTYWLSRLWIKTSRGEMHDDPVVYAVRNRGSRLIIVGMVLTVLAARFAGPEWMTR